MKPKLFLLVFVIILATLVLSSCSGASLNNSWPGLATDGQTAYLADGQFLYAVNLSNGQEVWRYPAKADRGLQFLNKPTIADDGTIIVGSAGNNYDLIALDPSNMDASTNTPQQKWTFTGAKNRWIASPLVMNNKVFAPNTDGILYVLDLQDGLSTKSAKATIELGGALWSQPVTDGKLVYVSTLDHHLYAIDPNTYAMAWSPVDLGGASPGSPLIGTDGNLYVGSFASEVIEIDPASGQASTLVSTHGWVWDKPTLDGNSIYFGDLEGYFYAVDASSGSIAWSVQLDGPIVGGAVVMPDYLAIATELGSVYAIDPTGNIVWQRAIGGRIFTMPVNGSDRIVVAPIEADYSLAALDTNGNQVWTFQPAN